MEIDMNHLKILLVKWDTNKKLYYLLQIHTNEKGTVN